MKSFLLKKSKTVDVKKERRLGAYALKNTTVYHSKPKFDQFVQQGYEQNVIVYRCVNLIAKALASVPLILYETKQSIHGVMDEHEVDAHPVLSLLNMPGPMQAGSAFMEEIVSYLLLSGNSFVEAILDNEGFPLGLRTIRPDSVKVSEGAYEVMDRDDIYADVWRFSKSKRIIEKEMLTGRSNLLHMKLFNPRSQLYGLSPLAAAAKAIDQHNAVGGHNLSLLQNGGRPTGALMLKGHENGLGLSDMQRQSLRADLKHALEGQENAGRVMILEGDFAWQEMGLTPKDLDFVEGKNLAAREICQVFGVPPMLAGVPGDATFANYREARFHLWEDTILPLLDFLITELNGWLLPYYATNLRLGYDLDQIQPLASKREMIWQKIASVDFLTINEKRQAVGYGPLPDGERLAKIKESL